ncbi:MAG: heme-binding domain-containing protein, partial [Bacteroidota bacterium]
MTINKKKITWISAAVIAITLVGIQWIKVTPNNSGNKQFHISKAYPTSYRVGQLLDHACNDCHSNTT